MSCLILSDMSLSDQIAVELTHALTIEGEMAKLEKMLHDRRVKHYPSTLPTPVTAAEITTPPVCTDAVVAGNFIEELA